MIEPGITRCQLVHVVVRRGFHQAFEGWQVASHIGEDGQIIHFDLARLRQDGRQLVELAQNRQPQNASVLTEVFGWMWAIHAVEGISLATSLISFSSSSARSLRLR